MGRRRFERAPTVTDPAAPPLRPERRVPNSIATMRSRLIAALVRTLPDRRAGQNSATVSMLLSPDGKTCAAQEFLMQ
jgi:hypothetical protein